jgi:hypothetical protein
MNGFGAVHVGILCRVWGVAMTAEQGAGNITTPGVTRSVALRAVDRCLYVTVMWSF